MKALILTGITLLSSSAIADVYKVDTSASRVEWRAGKKLGDTHTGTVKIKSGKIETDAKGQIEKMEVVTDMKTIDNDDLKGNAKYHKMLVDHLSSDDFFKVSKHPESTFKLTKVVPKAASKVEYIIGGQLTMLGKTAPVEFPATLNIDKDKITGTATVKIERLKWDLKYGSESFFKALTADKIINDEFDLILNIVAQK